MAANQHEMIWISQLIAEKDRLIHEKDELVASKDRIWRKMHRIIKEKDAQIAELSAGRVPNGEDTESIMNMGSLVEENRRLQERVDELEDALRQTLAEDDDDEEDEGEDEGLHRGANGMVQTVYNPEPMDINRHTPARLTPNPPLKSARSGQIDRFSVQTSRLLTFACSR